MGSKTVEKVCYQQNSEISEKITCTHQEGRGKTGVRKIGNVVDRFESVVPEKRTRGGIDRLPAEKYDEWAGG